MLVFRSADPDYFIPHVDVTRIPEYRAEAAKLAGEPSLALMFRHLSASRLVTIAQIEGRVRAAGSEFVLACDMRFAARETAIFAQPEPAFGLVPGGGGIQHLVRLMGRGAGARGHARRRGLRRRAGRAIRLDQPRTARPELGDFVASLAHRIAGFPAGSLAAVKDRVNAIALAPIEDFRRNSDLFGEAARNPEAQGRFQAAFERGFQTPGLGTRPGPNARRPGATQIGRAKQTEGAPMSTSSTAMTPPTNPYTTPVFWERLWRTERHRRRRLLRHRLPDLRPSAAGRRLGRRARRLL